MPGQGDLCKEEAVKFRKRLLTSMSFPVWLLIDNQHWFEIHLWKFFPVQASSHHDSYWWLFLSPKRAFEISGQRSLRGFDIDRAGYSWIGFRQRWVGPSQQFTEISCSRADKHALGPFVTKISMRMLMTNIRIALQSYLGTQICPNPFKFGNNSENFLWYVWAWEKHSILDCL